MSRQARTWDIRPGTIPSGMARTLLETIEPEISISKASISTTMRARQFAGYVARRTFQLNWKSCAIADLNWIWRRDLGQSRLCRQAAERPQYLPLRMQITCYGASR